MWIPSERRQQQAEDAWARRQEASERAGEVNGAPYFHWRAAAHRLRVDGHRREAEWLLWQLCKASLRKASLELTQHVATVFWGDLAKLYKKAGELSKREYVLDSQSRLHDAERLPRGQRKALRARLAMDPFPAIEPPQELAHTTSEDVSQYPKDGVALIDGLEYPIEVVLEAVGKKITFQSGLEAFSDKRGRRARFQRIWLPRSMTRLFVLHDGVVFEYERRGPHVVSRRSEIDVATAMDMSAQQHSLETWLEETVKEMRASWSDCGKQGPCHTVWP